jgi:hypothetical protein
MPKSARPASAELTASERRQQLAEILARGALCRVRQAREQVRQESAESTTRSLDVHTESRLSVLGVMRPSAICFPLRFRPEILPKNLNVHKCTLFNSEREELDTAGKEDCYRCSADGDRGKTCGVERARVR